jgi:site-specific recombinase XerD
MGCKRSWVQIPAPRPGDLVINSRSLLYAVKHQAKHLSLKIKPHDFRQLFVLNSWKNGEDAHILQIQKNLGHQSLATTEGYTNIGYDYKDASSNFLEF